MTTSCTAGRFRARSEAPGPVIEQTGMEPCRAGCGILPPGECPAGQLLHSLPTPGNQSRRMDGKGG